MNADVLDLNTFSAKEVKTEGLNVNGVTGLNGNVDIRADVHVTRILMSEEMLMLIKIHL